MHKLLFFGVFFLHCTDLTSGAQNHLIQQALHKLDDVLAQLQTLQAKNLTCNCCGSQGGLGASGGSCKEIFDNNQANGDKAYTIQTASGIMPVYCHMTNTGLGACGGGGWTLVMKTDGSKRTFHYDSHYWTNQQAYNFLGGRTGLDSQETKLPTYWSTPFTKICLGMKIGPQVNFIVVNQIANSLYDLIADGKYRATSLGRATWKQLIGSQGSLQSNCNHEGFNAASSYSKARIGIVSNDQYECVACDSRIGFGTGGAGAGVNHDDNTCGNDAIPNSDNGEQHVEAMGYIFVQ